MPEMSTPSKDIYRCRKCRYLLNINDAVMQLSSANSTTNESTLFLDIDTCPDWIQALVNQSGWTRGRINCPKCSSRLGSFDFVGNNMAHQTEDSCPASPVCLLKSKLDNCSPRPITVSAALAARPDRPACLKPAGLSLMPETSSEMDRQRCDKNTDCDNKLKNEKNNCDRLSEKGKASIDPLDPETLYSHVHDNNLSRQDSVEEDTGNACTVTIDNRFRLLEIDQDPTAEQEGRENLGNAHTTRHRKDRSQVFDESGIPDKLNETNQFKSPTVDEMLGEDDIPHEMSCPVCLEVMYSPFKCQPCKHMFCEICLRRFGNQSTVSRLTLCPLCRNVIQNCIQDTECTDLNKEVNHKFQKQYRKRRCVLKRMNMNTHPLPKCRQEVAVARERREHNREHFHPFIRIVEILFNFFRGIPMILIFLFMWLYFMISQGNLNGVRRNNRNVIEGLNNENANEAVRNNRYTRRYRRR